MNNLNSVKKDIAISRITMTFFAFSLLSLLAWLYILPFKKHYLVINNYYRYIEYVVMAVAFISVIAALVYFIKARKSGSLSEKIITPSMCLLYTTPAFVASVVIPLSGNRTLAYKYCVAVFLAIFIGFTAYHLINKGFAFYTAVCTSYCILFAFVDYMYPFDVNFLDKISLSYPAMIALFIIFILLLSVISVAVYKKNNKLNVYYPLAFSAISIIAVIVRIFVLRFVSLIAVLTLILTYIFICVKEKKGFKFKK